MSSQKIWRITQAQIASMDVESAILQVDPEQIADDEVYGLHGAVRLRFEGARGVADILTSPASRKFVRALHARWPWAAYFLRLTPIRADSPMPRIVDASVFLTLVLCHVDAMTYVETPQGITLRFDGDQFRRHLAELQARAAQLSEAVDMPSTCISQRDALISRTVASFFAAGQALNPKPNP